MKIAFSRLRHLLSKLCVQAAQEAGNRVSLETSAALPPLSWRSKYIPARSDVVSAIGDMAMRVCTAVLQAPRTEAAGAAGAVERAAAIEVEEGLLAARARVSQEVHDLQLFGVHAPLLLVHRQQLLQLALHLGLLLQLHLRGESHLHQAQAALGEGVKGIRRHGGRNLRVGEGHLALHRVLRAMELCEEGKGVGMCANMLG